MKSPRKFVSLFFKPGAKCPFTGEASSTVPHTKAEGIATLFYILFSSLYFKGQKEMFSVDLYFVSVKFLMCYTILTFQLSTQFIYYDI